MPRWKPQDSKTILQMIADDERRSSQERAEADRAIAELNVLQSSPSPRRLGRNSNVPQSQSDIDADLEQALIFHPNDSLTMADQIEIERGLPQSTKSVLDAIGDNILLRLFSNNEADVPVLVDCVSRTESEIVKVKALQAIRVISQHSTIPSARHQASEFLNQLDNKTQEN
jgi:hypothetical protein